MSTLSNYKTQNQIFIDFISLVKSALNSFELTNWEVRQLRGVFKINVLNPTVFISILSSNQLGQQYDKKIKTDDSVIRKNFNKQEVTIRFSATRKRMLNDNAETLEGNDILKVIRAYMQSPEGIKKLASMGYAQYRSNIINNINFTDDSENFCILPSFDCTFLYTDEWTTEIGVIKQVKDKGIYKI